MRYKKKKKEKETEEKEEMNNILEQGQKPSTCIQKIGLKPARESQNI